MHEFLVSVLAFIVLVGVMVVVHEFGHFIVAKACGVRVEAFSLGFGPRLFGFKYGDTDYKVCLLPLGGFVKMTGETPDQITGSGSTGEFAEDPGAFTSHPRWQRMLIGVAGPVANFLLTIAIMWVYYGVINEVPASTVPQTTVEWVTPDSAAAKSGLETGDIVTRFDNLKNPDWEQIYEHTKVNAGLPVPMSIERNGQSLSLLFQVPSSAKSDAFDLSDAGLLPMYLSEPIKVAEVEPGTPAEKAGLRAVDAIEAVDGHAFHFVSTLLAYMQWEQGKPLALTVLRNGQTVDLTATPVKLDSDYKLGFAAAATPIRNEPLPLGQALGKSVDFFTSNSALVGEVLARLVTHRLSVSQLMGPVGIARVAGQAAEMNGWMPKFGLAGQISLQLGILNLMPFPILDGGLILLLLIESLLRHDISLVIKERIYQAAFVVLMAFFALVLFNDVSKLPIFTHLKP